MVITYKNTWKFLFGEKAKEVDEKLIREDDNFSAIGAVPKYIKIFALIFLLFTSIFIVPYLAIGNLRKR
jgi:hypothetical protein